MFNLEDYLSNQNNQSSSLKEIIFNLAGCGKDITKILSRINIDKLQGYSADINIQGEHQKKLDKLTDDLITNSLKNIPSVAGICSEEQEFPIYTKSPNGEYLVFIDPLDGSTNIEINVAIGTIFSIYKTTSHDITYDDFISQTGTRQLATGFILYGSSTELVFTLGDGVHNFTLDKQLNQFFLTKENFSIPPIANEFAINYSNCNFWHPPVVDFINYCCEIDDENKKRYNMRWIASLVAETFRVLQRGGIFLYPSDKSILKSGGRLRLMYEVNPIGFLIEQAGGLAIDGFGRVLDIKPTTIHQRVPMIFGSCENVAICQSYYKKI